MDIGVAGLHGPTVQPNAGQVSNTDNESATTQHHPTEAVVVRELLNKAKPVKSCLAD